MSTATGPRAVPPRPIIRNGDLTDLPAALAPLIAERRWLPWRLAFTSDRGVWTKVPVRATSTSEDRWLTYDGALDAMREEQADGLGFALTGGPFAAFDLDKCREGVSGTLDAWADELVAASRSYTEVTVSGTGLRIIGRASTIHPDVKQKVGETGASLETYRGGSRFITVSGLEIPQSTPVLADLDRVMAETVERLKQARPRPGRPRKPRIFDDLPKALQTLIEEGVSVGDRSGQFMSVVAWLRRLGWNVDETVAILGQHPAGIAEKFIDRLREEVERVVPKLEVPPAAWLADCLCNSDGTPIPNLANVMLALRRDPAVTNVVSLDQMLCAPVLTGVMPGAADETDWLGDFKPRPITDVDVGILQEWLQHAGLRRIGKETAHQAIGMRAQERAFHPVRDHLSGLTWDGTARLETWMHRYLGAEANPYTAGIGRMFLIAMVARVCVSACNFDPVMRGIGVQF